MAAHDTAPDVAILPVTKWRSVQVVPVRSIVLIFFVALTLAVLSVSTAQAQVPAALYRDPPPDAKYPATGGGMQFPSHGVLVNAQLYRPAGAGVHPTVILLHGLPGNEQNLDLARVLQRAGWTVITFHYRGSWGSPGTFSFRHALEDADALVTRLLDPAIAKTWGVDPAHIVIAGHSFGGYVAARTAVAHPSLLAVALLAPWDISYDARMWSRLSKSRLAEVGPENFDDVMGRLAGATPVSLARDIMREGPTLDLTALAAPLSSRRLLVVTATRDDTDDKAIGLLADLERRHGTMFASKVLPTDHGFNDQRIALEIIVLNWLARLPGAPRSNQ